MGPARARTFGGKWALSKPSSRLGDLQKARERNEMRFDFILGHHAMEL
jgi:hypothetical protein